MDELTLTEEHNLGLYDSATGETIKPEKGVDITQECPELTYPDSRCILLYGRAKDRGRLVQITFPHKDEVYMGSHTHFFVDELSHPVRPQNDTFAIMCRQVGLSRQSLIAIIRENAPAANSPPRPIGKD